MYEEPNVYDNKYLSLSDKILIEEGFIPEKLEEEISNFDNGQSNTDVVGNSLIRKLERSKNELDNKICILESQICKEKVKREKIESHILQTSRNLKQIKLLPAGPKYQVACDNFLQSTRKEIIESEMEKIKSQILENVTLVVGRQ